MSKIFLLGNIASIAFFNFAGISVTKEMSATTRMVLDSVRTLVIWAIALMLTWQTFQYVQVFGFLLLLIGMCLYNGVIIQPGFEYLRNRRQNQLTIVENDQEPLIGNGPGNFYDYYKFFFINYLPISMKSCSGRERNFGKGGSNFLLTQMNNLGWVQNCFPRNVLKCSIKCCNFLQNEQVIYLHTYIVSLAQGGGGWGMVVFQSGFGI